MDWFLFLQMVIFFKGQFHRRFAGRNWKVCIKENGLAKHKCEKCFCRVEYTNKLAMVLNKKTIKDIEEEFANLRWEPYVSSRKLKSKVWRYILCPYVFGNLVSRRYVRCRMCNDPIYWMGSTSNLTRHFKSKHKDADI